MKTLAQPASYREEIKRSRFVAHAARIDSEADTLAFHDRVADPQATHNCWAFKLGGRYRFADDGEPSSSAGRPILAAIEGQSMDHVMVVVTRYYGGTKLGIGGLIRAYGGTAARCLQSGEVEVVRSRRTLRVQVPFPHMDGLHRLLQELGGEKLGEDYGNDGAILLVSIEEQHLRELDRRLRDLSDGRASIRTVNI